jgi:hypothetical protein
MFSTEYFLHILTALQTYGIQHISKEQYEKTAYEYDKPGGCREKLAACQKLAEAEDPDWRGNVPSVIKCFDDIHKVDCASMDTFEQTLTVSFPPDSSPLSKCCIWI